MQFIWLVFILNTKKRNSSKLMVQNMVHHFQNPREMYTLLSVKMC
jgi:hypothetical protein